MSGWKPIEDCPKSEAYGPFLVFAPMCKDWDNPRNIHKTWWSASEDDLLDFGKSDTLKAIFWRPMPDSPVRN